MKITTAGLPASSSDETVRPVTAAGRAKGGRADPRASMEDDTAMAELLLIGGGRRAPGATGGPKTSARLAVPPVQTPRVSGPARNRRRPRWPLGRDRRDAR